jgi:hypothetical protein
MSRNIKILPNGHIEMMPEVNQALLTVQPGEVIEVFHAEMKP